MPRNKWIFHSTSAKQKVGAHRIQNEQRYASGQIMAATKVLTFNENIFITDNAKEAEEVRRCQSFKIGKIKEINEEQYAAVNKRKAAVVGVATTHDHYITEEDKKRAAQVPDVSPKPQPTTEAKGENIPTPSP